MELLFPGATIGSTAKAETSARRVYVRSQLDAAGRRSSSARSSNGCTSSGSRSSATSAEEPPRRSARRPRLAWETLCAIEEDYGIDLFAERSVLYPARALRSWITDLGLLGATAGTKHIPPDLLTMPDEQTWALLAGLWLTDGWLSITDSHGPDISVCTQSRQLAEDVRLLLRRVGVRSSIRRRVVRGSLYRSVSIARDGYDRLRQMPLVGVKADRRDQILALPRSSRFGNRGDMIPSSFNGMITKWSSPSGAYRTADHRHHPMNRANFRDFVRGRSVADEETTWSPVTSVRSTGRSASCYDIRSTPTNISTAESFVVHNSTLIESLRWALYGDSRTDKWSCGRTGWGRTSGSSWCFEHEGTPRRAAAAEGAQPHARGRGVPERALAASRAEANAYLARVSGWTSGVPASVCAQQKELTAFSTMLPATGAAGP